MINTYVIAVKGQRQQNTTILCLKREQKDFINLYIQTLLGQLSLWDLGPKSTSSCLRIITYASRRPTPAGKKEMDQKPKSVLQLCSHMYWPKQANRKNSIRLRLRITKPES